MKRTTVTAQFSPNPEESFAVVIEIPNDYPDALATARSEAVRAVREMSRDSIVTYRASVDE